eukprot:355849-Chlamydomonas_euryale.AAC.2
MAQTQLLPLPGNGRVAFFPPRAVPAPSSRSQFIGGGCGDACASFSDCRLSVVRRRRMPERRSLRRMMTAGKLPPSCSVVARQSGAFSERAASLVQSRKPARATPPRASARYLYRAPGHAVHSQPHTAFYFAPSAPPKRSLQPPPHTPVSVNSNWGIKLMRRMDRSPPPQACRRVDPLRQAPATSNWENGPLTTTSSLPPGGPTQAGAGHVQLGEREAQSRLQSE